MSKVTAYSSLQPACTTTENRMPYGIKQRYLPPGSGDNPALTPAKSSTQFNGGMQGWVDLHVDKQLSVHVQSNLPQWIPLKWITRLNGISFVWSYSDTTLNIKCLVCFWKLCCLVTMLYIYLSLCVLTACVLANKGVHKKHGYVDTLPNWMLMMRSQCYPPERRPGSLTWLMALYECYYLLNNYIQFGLKMWWEINMAAASEDRETQTLQPYTVWRLRYTRRALPVDTTCLPYLFIPVVHAC